jgi:hypothetical protein
LSVTDWSSSLLERLEFFAREAVVTLKDAMHFL